jgi:hypothetical protein
MSPLRVPTARFKQSLTPDSSLVSSRMRLVGFVDRPAKWAMYPGTRPIVWAALVPVSGREQRTHSLSPPAYCHSLDENNVMMDGLGQHPHFTNSFASAIGFAAAKFHSGD